MIAMIAIIHLRIAIIHLRIPINYPLLNIVLRYL